MVHCPAVETDRLHVPPTMMGEEVERKEGRKEGKSGMMSYSKTCLSKRYYLYTVITYKLRA